MCFCKAKLAFPQVIMAAAQIINTNNYHQRIDGERWVYFLIFHSKCNVLFIAKTLCMDDYIVILLLD